MKISEDRRGMAGGVDLVALWETGDGLGGAPVFKGKAKPGANRWVRRAGALSMNWAAVAAGLMVLTLVPFLAQEGSRPPALNEGSPLDGVLGVDPFVAEAGAGAMSPGFPSDGSDVERAQDPSLMVLGPERPGVATAAAPASAPTAPASKAAGATDWAAALKNAVRTAAPAAVKRAGLPSPSARLAGALKAIAAGAGSSASKASSSPSEALRLSAPSSKDLLSAFKASDSLQLRRSEPLLRSLARGGPVTSGAQGGVAFPSSLPSSARPAGGSASENLRDAVSAFGSPSANGQGGGGPAVFDGGKGPGANPAGVAKAPGESLEFMRKKMEMEKEMDLKYAKRKYNELGRQEMLDKVNAESAAKMKETVAGKMIDGAFGLAQKAMGGEGGGKGGAGGEESAVEANRRAQEEARKLGPSAQRVGNDGREVAMNGRQAMAGKDKILAPDVAPPLLQAGARLTSAAGGTQSVQQLLLAAGQSLDGSHQAIAKANEESKRQNQGNQKYANATGQYIQSLNIETPPQAPPGNGPLNTGANAQGPLGKADQGRQSADGSRSQANQTAASLARNLAPEKGQLGQVVRKVGNDQAEEYSAFRQLVPEITARESNLVSNNQQVGSAISVGDNASAATAQARQKAEAAFREADMLRTELNLVETNLQSAVPQLQAMSEEYLSLKAIPDTSPLAAWKTQRMPQLLAAFNAMKGQLDSSLKSQAQKISGVDQRIQEAKTKLGGHQ